MRPALHVGARANGSDRVSALLTPRDEQERVRARLELVTRLGETIGDARDLVELFRTLHAETSRVMDATVFLLSM